MNAFKRSLKKYCGRRLVAFADAFPGTKSLLAPIGMRTFEGFFGSGVPIHAQTPSGDSIRLVTGTRNYLTLQLFWKGTIYYEPITTFLITELLKTGGTFIDVGANIGFFSLVIGRQLPNVRIFAFEPNPKNYDLLQKNVAANGFSTIRAEALAVSGATGMASLFLHPSDMSASLCSDVQHQPLSRETVDVRVTTLDSYFETVTTPLPMVVKIDVEGHEAAVLRGAPSFLQHHSPDLILEVLKPYPEDVIHLLHEVGYLFYQITNDGLTQVTQLDLVRRGDLVFLNYLLSRKPGGVLENLSESIIAHAKNINLRRTSKYFGPSPTSHGAANSSEQPSEAEKPLVKVQA